MKKLVVGVCMGVLVAGVVAHAATYYAEDASFKIFVNGNEFTTSKAVVIDGSTYLPLRAMGDALGVNVEWNAEQHQVEIGDAPAKQDENVYSRNNPAPLNTMQTYSRKNTNSYIDMSSISPDYSANIRITDVIRGANANEKVKNDNMFNEDAPQGYEYILARVSFSLISSQNDVSINANGWNFKFYSSNNEEYENVFVSINDELSTDLYPGGNAEGYIVGLVKVEDPAPKLAYGLDYNGVNGIWFALN